MAHERYRRQTRDRQQTDGRAIAYSEFTFSNKTIDETKISACILRFLRKPVRDDISLISDTDVRCGHDAWPGDGKGFVRHVKPSRRDDV